MINRDYKNTRYESSRLLQQKVSTSKSPRRSSGTETVKKLLYDFNDAELRGKAKQLLLCFMISAILVFLLPDFIEFLSLLPLLSFLPVSELRNAKSCSEVIFFLFIWKLIVQTALFPLYAIFGQYSILFIYILMLFLLRHESLFPGTMASVVQRLRNSFYTLPKSLYSKFAMTPRMLSRLSPRSQRKSFKKLRDKSFHSNSCIEIGHSSMQGYRNKMEDTFIICDMPSAIDHTLLAIMDGHAGDGAAELVSHRLIASIEATSNWHDYLKSNRSIETIEHIEKAFTKAFYKLDQEIRESSRARTSGCTCVCVIITPTFIVCANIGDSRCLLKSGNKVITLSEDHKPNRPDELKRIERSGGRVEYNRVNGQLAVSRAFGDFQYKSNRELPHSEQMVVCTPEVKFSKRSDRDELLVLACDGVWDVMSNKDAFVFLTEAIQKSDESDNMSKIRTEPSIDDTYSCKFLAGALIDWALASGSKDNLSCIIARLNSH